MKGIVFTEFLEMVEEKFGFDVADNIVTQADLPSGGVYTGVGTYAHAEMVSLVVNLSEESKLPVPALLKAFGLHLFGRFSQLYQQSLTHAQGACDFLSRIESYIHTEVRKLYPDAELPYFHVEQPDADTLVIVYESERGMADFAEGLLEGCISHFGEVIAVKREDVKADKTVARFTLKRTA